jgi:hypothetical protein
MGSRLSVRMIEDHPLISRDAAWAFVRVPLISYKFSSDAEKDVTGATIEVRTGLLRVGRSGLERKRPAESVLQARESLTVSPRTGVSLQSGSKQSNQERGQSVQKMSVKTHWWSLVGLLLAMADPKAAFAHRFDGAFSVRSRSSGY